MACRCSPWDDFRGEARKTCGAALGFSAFRTFWQAAVHGSRGRWDVLLSTYRAEKVLPTVREALGPFATKAAAKRAAWEKSCGGRSASDTATAWQPRSAPSIAAATVPE